MAEEDKGGELKQRILRAAAPSPGEGQDEQEFQLTVKEKRIDVIVRMMCSGNWVTGLSHQMLADAWGLSIPSVEGIAAEANRHVRMLVRLAPEEQKDMLARLVQNVERLAQKAEARGSKTGYRDALEANKFLAQLFGVVKTEVEVADKRGEFATYTDAELEQYLRTGERPKKKTS